MFRKIGGMAGLGAEQIRAKFTISKKVFSPGEKVVVKVDMDNSDCGKAVKSYKFKLLRMWSIPNTTQKGEGYVQEFKFEGHCCQAKAKEEGRMCEFELSIND